MKRILPALSAAVLLLQVAAASALPADAADLWVGQDGDDAIYLADRLAERILVFDKESGAYLEQFQAAEGSPLRDLRSLFVDRVHSTQYLLTDSSLYQERLPR